MLDELDARVDVFEDPVEYAKAIRSAIVFYKTGVGKLDVYKDITKQLKEMVHPIALQKNFIYAVAYALFQMYREELKGRRFINEQVTIR